MLACTALVGCTSEDSLENGVNNPASGKAKAYVSVKMIMAESAGSRATTDGGYDEGVTTTLNEQTINWANTAFFFYEDNGAWVAHGTLSNVDLTESESGDATDHGHSSDVNSIYNEACIVLEGPDQTLKKSKQVLAIVNFPGWDKFKNKDLDTTLKELADASHNAIGDNFLMSTSVYYQSDDPSTANVSEAKLVQTTAIDGDVNIQADPDDAKDNPIKIYIERAAAKVQVTSGKTNDNPTGTVITSSGTVVLPVEGDDTDSDPNSGDENLDIAIDGVQKEAYVSIEGWIVNNVNPNTYIVKQAESSWANTFKLCNTLWNGEADHRSFWAKATKWSESDGSSLTAYSYNDAVDVLSGADFTVENKAKDDFNLINNAMYCNEQTVQNCNVDPFRGSIIAKPNATTVLIAAKIKLAGETEGTYADAGNLYKYGGVFYSETGLENLLLQRLMDKDGDKYVKKATKKQTIENEDGTTAEKEVTVYSDLTPDDISIEPAENSLAEISVMVNKEATYVACTKITRDEEGKITAVEEVTDSDIDYEDIKDFINGLDYVKDTVGYNNGMCYYQIPIEHYGSEGSTDGITDDSTAEEFATAKAKYVYGVVRNHWYQLNISKIVRVGEPVYNPSELIPQIPQKQTNYYLAAELHVLSWHVVEQDVTLD